MRDTAASAAYRAGGGRAGWPLVVLLCAALWLSPGEPASAQAPPSVDESTRLESSPQVSAQGPVAAARQSGVAALLLAALASLGLLVLWLARRAYQAPEVVFDEEPVIRQPAPLVARTALPPPRAVARTPSAVGGLVRAGNTPRLAAELLMLATRAESRRRECPDCKRVWASWMVVCPVDGAALGPAQAVRTPKVVGRGEAVMPRLMCPGCGRRYEQGATFCPYDGHELLHDSPEEASKAPSFVVCRTCGREVGGGKSSCRCKREACDEVMICPVEASAQSARLPAVPLTVCPRCNRYGKPGQLHCEHDGALLLPVTDIHVQTFPHTGFGPRRKVCRKCGEQFSSASAYCCHDGEALVSLD